MFNHGGTAGNNWLQIQRESEIWHAAETVKFYDTDSAVVELHAVKLLYLGSGRFFEWTNHLPLYIIEIYISRTITGEKSLLSRSLCKEMYELENRCRGDTYWVEHVSVLLLHLVSWAGTCKYSAKQWKIAKEVSGRKKKKKKKNHSCWINLHGRMCTWGHDCTGTVDFDFFYFKF